MSSKQDAIKIANNTGFPLQIAVERQVEDTKPSHGWNVRYAEHSWLNNLDKQSGFIDLVLQDQFKSTFLVVECKRVKDATWLFLHSNGETMPRRHSKSWVSHYADGRMKHFNWYDVPVDPPCAEAIFCAVRGQSASNKSTMLERIGGELISATEALAQEEQDFRSSNHETIRFYFNVVVTTAELKVAKFDPKEISLIDGKLANAEIQSVPFVRFRKQLSMRRNLLFSDDYNSGKDPAYEKQNTVFVVRADAIVDFLKKFEIPDSSVRKF